MAGLFPAAATAAPAADSLPTPPVVSVAVAGHDIPAPAGSVVAVATGAANSLVFANITAVNPSAVGHLVAYPCAAGKPATSTANYAPGRNTSAGTAVMSDGSGYVCVYTSAATHILFDQQGAGAPNTLNLVGAKRLTDTRWGFGPVKPGEVRTVATGAPGGALVLATVAAVTPASSGWLSVRTCGTAWAGTSSVSYSAGRTTANLVAVNADANGNICVTSSTPTNVLVDRVSATRMISASPGRLVDTRASGAMPAAGSVTRVRTGTPGVVVGANVTAVGAPGPGWVAAYPCSSPRPVVSSLAFTSATTSNYVTVKADQAGEVCLYTSAPAHLLFDRQSVAVTSVAAPAPVRKLDTRTLEVPLHPRTGKAFYPNVARWAPQVADALVAAGLTDDYTPGVLAQIQQESAGIPTAVNTWDSNWQAGIASFGLLQTIYPTFNAYAPARCKGANTGMMVNGRWQAYTPTMVDPGCNIAAGINYVRGRYGLSKFDSWNTGNNPAY